MSLAQARARLASVPASSTKSLRRSYSIFAKSGGGRFITAAKVPKPLGSPGSSTTTNNASTSSEVTSDASTKGDSASMAKAPIGDEPAEQLTVTDPKSKADLSSTTTTPLSSDKDSSILSSASSATATSNSPQVNSSKSFAHTLESHPRPSKEAISLHSFFSLHRPLLLLPIHATQPIFTSSPVQGTILDGIKSRQHPLDENTGSESLLKGAMKRGDVAPSSRIPRFEVDLGSGRPILMSLDGATAPIQTEDQNSPEADADAARLLGRSYVLSRIGSVVDWQATLGRLGDRTAQEEVDEIKAVAEQCEAQAEEDQVHVDSVKRKRKRKMNKHIFKKRRKKERAQRRRLGK